MNITDKSTKEYVKEFSKSNPNIQLANEIHSVIDFRENKSESFKFYVKFIGLVFLISIGVTKIYSLYLDFLDSGDFLLLVVGGFPFLLLLHFIRISIVHFIEARMESNKRLVSAKEFRLIKKEMVVSRRHLRKREGKLHRVRNKYFYFYILNNGGDNIIVEVDGKSRFNRFEEGLMVPIYRVRKSWLFFDKDELHVFYN